MIRAPRRLRRLPAPAPLGWLCVLCTLAAVALAAWARAVGV